MNTIICLLCRYYRAPELLLASTKYTTTVDLWSLGCVLAEMPLLQPLLAGEDSGDQLAEIVELIGVPSSSQLEAMGIEDVVLATAIGSIVVVTRDIDDISAAEKITNIVGHDYTGLGELIGTLLRYDPRERNTAKEIQEDTFFRQVRRRKGSITQ